MTTVHRFITGGLLVAFIGASQAVGQTQAGKPVNAAGRGAAPPAAAAVPEYRIGPEDVLDIVVWKNPELSTRGLQVRPDGRISLPLVNDVQAAGLTPMELRAALVHSLEGFFENFSKLQDVSVTVREVHSVKVSVLGNVKAPNRYELRSQITVLEALALAGGFNDFANKDQVAVIRNGKRLMFNYEKFLKEPGGQENYLLQSGDVVIVP